MIHLQIVARSGEGLQSLLRKAIAEGKIKSFEVAQVKGGLKIKHKKHLGAVILKQGRGPLLATVTCKNPEKEWQMLEAFVGRLAYHFRDAVAAINIQFEN